MTLTYRRFKDYPPICHGCGDVIFEAHTRKQSWHPSCRPTSWQFKLARRIENVSASCRNYNHKECQGFRNTGKGRAGCWCACHGPAPFHRPWTREEKASGDTPRVMAYLSNGGSE